MNDCLQDLMQEATRLTRAGRLNEATAVLQRAMRGGDAGIEAAPAAAMAPVIQALPRLPAPQAAPSPAQAAPSPAQAARSTAPAAFEPGRFTRATHTHAGLTLDYKLYVPPGPQAHPRALVVMLHGCKQDPDDFAAGTGMNLRAAEQGFIVLYPAQAQGANPAACWNWFKPNHQQRGRGEPALIANLTQAVIKAHGVDPRRVYVAGLSAGGAMAAVLGQAYPELFAAVGVHSGLPVGTAHDVMSALAVMKSGTATAPLRREMGMRQAAAPRPVPTIVFHGDQDTTVHPHNGEQIVAGLLRAEAGMTEGGIKEAGMAPVVEQGLSDQGRRFTRTLHQDAQGRARVEHWQLHGAGHAWSGGDRSGSYTDPKGPDATREMLRFFFQHLNLGG